MADSNKCGVEIKVPKNQKDLIWSITNRNKEYQKTINKDMSGSRFREPSFLSLECRWEFEKESRARSYAEMNTLFHLASQKLKLPIKSHAIIMTTQEMKELCKNCYKIIKHSISRI